MGKPEPSILGAAMGRTAEWEVVTKKIFSFVRSIRYSRKVFAKHFKGHAIPCENDCGTEMVFGEPILVVHIPGKPDRFFCSVACQRKNFLNNPRRLKATEMPPEE